VRCSCNTYLYTSSLCRRRRPTSQSTTPRSRRRPRRQDATPPAAFLLPRRRRRRRRRRAEGSLRATTAVVRLCRCPLSRQLLGRREGCHVAGQGDECGGRRDGVVQPWRSSIHTRRLLRQPERRPVKSLISHSQSPPSTDVKTAESACVSALNI